MLRIRIVINADPDPAFTSMRIRIYGAKPMRIRILVRLCRHKKLDFDIKNILYAGNMSLNIRQLRTLVGTKAIVIFGQFPLSWIPALNQCGSGSETLLLT